jgi:peptide-methionine (S)-S-oxide reductase
VKTFAFFLMAASLAAAVSTSTAAEKKAMTEPASSANPTGAHLERITMGGGCFWCMEAVFQRLIGVRKVVSGYAGGALKDPTYEQVCTGTTGHAEVVQIEFDPKQLPPSKLLEVFFAAHDPTTLNRQGHDPGTQYRSVLFYENEEQKTEMENAKKTAQKEQTDPIVTEIVPLKTFYSGEGYHQNYYNQNADKNPYCEVVIRPKLQKLLQHGLIKSEPVQE